MPQSENFLEEFVEGKRVIGRVALNMENRQKAVDSFIALKNPYFQALRYKELAAIVARIIKPYIEVRLTKDEFDALSKAIHEVLSIWAGEWKEYPIEQAEYILILEFNDGVWGMSVGTELTKISAGASELDAVSCHPLTDSVFTTFIQG